MEKKTIETKQQDIAEEFSFLGDWNDRYSYLLELAKQMPIISEDKKTDSYLIRGCQSKVWVDFESRQDLIFFSADADAAIPKGIIALLIYLFNGERAEDIIQSDVLHFLASLELQEHLSPTRSNGLVNMVKQLKKYAGQFLAHTHESF